MGARMIMISAAKGFWPVVVRAAAEAAEDHCPLGRVGQHA